MTLTPLRAVVLFVGLAVALTIPLVEVDAFEWLYEVSRSHEDWELDEIVLAVFSALIAGTVTFALYTRTQAESLFRAAMRVDAAEGSSRRMAATRAAFVGALAHEIATPLNGIAALVPTTQSDPVTAKLLHESVRDLVLLARDLANLSDMMLGTGGEAPLEGADLQASVTGLELPAGRGVDISFDLPPRRFRLARGLRLDHVLGVLVTAFARAADTGRCTVAITMAGSVLEIRAVEPSFTADFDRLSAFIAGVRRLDATYDVRVDGLGLRLSILASAVEGEGGSLVVERVPPEGLVVIARLPVIA